MGKNWVGFALRTVTMRGKDRHSVYILRVNEYMNEIAAHSPLTSHSTPADLQITLLFSVVWSSTLLLLPPQAGAPRGHQQQGREAASSTVFISMEPAT